MPPLASTSAIPVSSQLVSRPRISIKKIPKDSGFKID
jgi:hypothetical protein